MDFKELLEQIVESIVIRIVVFGIFLLFTMTPFFDACTQLNN